MKKLKTLKDIELMLKDERLGICELDDIRESVKEWIKDCINEMKLADENKDRETYNFYAGKASAFREFFNLE